MDNTVIVLRNKLHKCTRIQEPPLDRKIDNCEKQLLLNFHSMASTVFLLMIKTEPSVGAQSHAPSPRIAHRASDAMIFGVDARR